MEGGFGGRLGGWRGGLGCRSLSIGESVSWVLLELEVDLIGHGLTSMFPQRLLAIILRLGRRANPSNLIAAERF